MESSSSNKDRARRTTDDTLGNASHEKSFQARAAVRTHNYEA